MRVWHKGCAVDFQSTYAGSSPATRSFESRQDSNYINMYRRHLCTIHIYKVTNQIEGKFYIGTHKTKDLNDGYLGSGKYLKRAQAKYGLENFSKQILHIYDNPEEMFQKEEEIVNPDFPPLPPTYNLKVGGSGGFDFINNDIENRIIKNKKARLATNITIFERYGVHNIAQIDYVKKANSARMIQAHADGKFSKTTGFGGRRHTEETKILMSISSQGKQVGESNSQFGTMWITNGVENKKVNKDSIIPNEWEKGRTIIKRL